ncbi:MAG: UDP-N-acetylglucosamine--N-acetylmuramyl-(pentapeptide) pyrophosphoryl-undecaprenol N-acetylglucosamine transferase [Lawsonibacter sp.]|nr:UDP-N-acetylglucosamine--N-acetylmuramyl-(pentapeptide) pyrophosphoryl-undecaprenol N-acetylglucosamine transferase [Lawsonibacter sp.]
MNILFTCGGTAGHVNPAVALAHIFQEKHPECRILFVGAEGGMENKLVPKEGYPIRSVTITNFRRSLAPADIAHNFGTLRNMLRSKKQARVILDKFQPDLVVGTGGYASFPVVKEAARRGIPTAVHESNAVPGLTTRALSKVVDRVMVGFEESRSHYDDPTKVVVTGTPVRGEFFSYTKREARDKLGFSDDRPLLLSYWGSLGAEVMNQKMLDFIAKECYEGSPYRHIHGAGRDFPWMNEELLRRGLELGENGIEVREYIYDMPLVMAAADLVLCRAGASTISELTVISKPAILIPSPNVTANHQEKNARVLSDQGAAVLLREQDCVGDTLYDTAGMLLRERDRRDDMVRALSTMAVPDAGEKSYQTLQEIMKKKK